MKQMNQQLYIYKQFKIQNKYACNIVKPSVKLKFYSILLHCKYLTYIHIKVKEYKITLNQII